MRVLFVLVAALSVALPLSGQEEEVRCTYTKREACGPKGCVPIAVADNYLIVPRVLLEKPQDLSATEIRRCDSKGCSAINAVANTAGAFMNAGNVERGFQLKVAVLAAAVAELKAGDFVETVTTMLTVLVGHGTCPKT